MQIFATKPDRKGQGDNASSEAALAKKPQPGNDKARARLRGKSYGDQADMLAPSDDLTCPWACRPPRWMETPMGTLSYRSCPCEASAVPSDPLRGPLGPAAA